MTSQKPARIELRRKPRRCGHQKFTTAAFRPWATRWAILFSKPSSLSLERGISYGPTHTFNSEGACGAAPERTASAAAAASHAPPSFHHASSITLLWHPEEVRS